MSAAEATLPVEGHTAGTTVTIRDPGSPAEEFAGAITAIGTAVAQVLVLLNDVTALKRNQILGLAETAAHPPSGSASRAGSSGAPSVAEATSQARAVADALAAHQTAPTGPSAIALLEQSVVHSLALAIQNTVAADQQLDILAQAVLARAAALVLEAGSGKVAEAKSANGGEGGRG